MQLIHTVAAIANEYTLAKGSLMNSLLHYHRCGELLNQQKSQMKHGQWLPWLESNEEVLGFVARNAQRMMDFANTTPASHLTDQDALTLGRALWGHTAGDTAHLLVSSESVEWYSPARYVDAARTVLGGIDLDPASNPTANEVVQASQWYGVDDDGLSRVWSGRVWLNPPWGNQSGPFATKLVNEWTTGNVSQAILLINSHCTDTEWFQPLWNHTLCFTNHRINFYQSNNDAPSGSTHGSAFVYFGTDVPLFKETFSQFGTVVRKI